jgi:UDP-N-acetyl-D-mannosaminuronic acid dehydrogenase
MPKIVVVGMGYVGIPLAVKFAMAGFDVIGLNRSASKIELINQGKSPIKNEPGLEALLKKAVARKKLAASHDFSQCRGAQAILICPETPFDDKRQEPNYASLKDILRKIGANLSPRALVVVESTIAPKTMAEVVIPLLEKHSGLRAGKDFAAAHCPERVMPGKLLFNIENVDRVIGGIDAKSCATAIQFYKSITRGHLHATDCLTAEIVKTAENAYRDVQIAFANEVARICENLGVDAYKVRELVNTCPIRNMHLPGAGVGGHCLPKDSLLLAYATKHRHVPGLILKAREINDEMPRHMIQLANAAFQKSGNGLKGKKLSVLGLSYLEDTDDTRNSPALEIIRGLKKRGGRVIVHDPLASSKKIRLERDLGKALKGSDAIILVTAHREYKKLNSGGNLKKLKGWMNTPVIIDGRNVFDREKAAKAGFLYLGIGKVGGKA